MMRFSEMKYERPDLAALAAEIEGLTEQVRSASSAAEQKAAFDRFEELTGHLSTLANLVYIRNSVNTKDEFYEKETEFLDENLPVLEEKTQAFSLALLDSPFRPELEKDLGKLFFTNIEIQRRTFSPEIIGLLQEENKLTTAYQRLYASCVVDFDGKKLPITKLGPYKMSSDRAVRHAAYETEGACFDSHRAELDDIYDKLVHVRTEMAKKLGYENFIPLAYDRLGRNCYGAEEVKAFREQIAREIVPIVRRVKELQKARIGVEKFCFYDDIFSFPDGNPKPQGTSDEILAAGRQMYREMSPETAEFIDFMFDNELFDVLAKEGKAPGGYCTDLADYGAPFVFSNFNGTSADVDVLTHEMGHAFAFYRAAKNGIMPEYRNPTYEACEVHSMSMEFLTSEHHEKFFGPETKKYEFAHCEDTLVFLPYGSMVDEFQHIVYENPDMKPEERNEVWANLEKKYRPYIDFDNLPFYSRGAGWQRQMHIYENPFYYIDYCMAQTVAFQIWMKMLENGDEAWKMYMKYTDKAGSMTFAELVPYAGLDLPYAPGCVGKVAKKIAAWLEEHAV